MLKIIIFSKDKNWTHDSESHFFEKKKKKPIYPSKGNIQINDTESCVIPRFCYIDFEI